jgi:serine phosphatase RsbU (regulator of sigma subunit)
VDTSRSLREATAETSSWLLDNEGKESSAPNATSDSLPSEQGATSDSNPVDSKLKTNPELSTSTPRIMRVRTAGRAPDRKELDQLVAQVRRRMQEDDILRQRDNRNRWFCPYCGKTCRDILFPDELALALQDTPFQIGDHLLRDCPAYKAEFEPSKRLAGDDHQEKAWQAGMHEARRRQRYMLPAKLPEVPGLDFECFFQPADYISGDFYDVIRVSEHELGIVIGDVAGHGIEAAIVMAMARKLIQVHGRGRSSAADTLCVVNADLADDLGEGVFLSAFYGVLDTRSFYMTCASAGHTPPLIYHAEHPVEVTRVSPRGLAIGLDRGPRFTRLIEEWVIELQPGDFFVSYTDGVIERENAEGEELGVDGLSDLVRKYGYRRPADALRQILSGVDKFADKPPDDDITLLSFRCYEVEDDDLGEEITAGQDATSP